MNLSNLGDENGRNVWILDCWVRVWESLSGLMPRLCCCAQKLGFYIPLKLMRAVSGRMWLFWQIEPVVFLLFLPIYCNVNIQIVTETIWTFLVYTLQNYNTELGNPISWERSKWSLTPSKSVSTGKMVLLKNPTIRLVNFTNGNDFFKVTWSLQATKIWASVKRCVTRVHECLMPSVNKTGTHIF